MRLLFLTFLVPFMVAAAQLRQTAILLAGHKLQVEIADTPQTREKGLMERPFLPEGQGMLFVYKEPALLSFWMKNTRIPLSIGFFDTERKLIATAEMAPTAMADAASADLPRYSSPAPALYALELPAEWFSKNGVRPGMKFSFLDSQDGVR